MAYVPKDACWYIADIVEELNIASRKRQTVYINSVLIKASSPEVAYAKALKEGQKSNHSYKNMYGEMVRCKFRGLRNLMVIYDSLEDGGELFYESRTLTRKRILRLVRKKAELSVFEPIGPKRKELFPKQVADELAKRMKRRKQRRS